MNRKKKVFHITIVVILVTVIFIVIRFIGKRSKSGDFADKDKLMSECDRKVNITIGETLDKGLWSQTFIYPDNIDDTFVIDICLPDNYDSTRKYPAVYLTDCYWRRGDYPAIKELYESGKTEEFILIGIGYPDDYNFDVIRERDLINNPRDFLKLIIEAVIPYVESNYSIDADNRSFLGASCGGYFMLYSLFQSDGLTKDIFKNYLICSPVFYYYDKVKVSPLVLEENFFTRNGGKLDMYVYITVGGTEDEKGFKQPLKNLVDTMQGRQYSGLLLEHEVYEGLGHYEVWVPSLLEGLERCLGKNRFSELP